jgi:hypothetical protein
MISTREGAGRISAVRQKMQADFVDRMKMHERAADRDGRYSIFARTCIQTLRILKMARGINSQVAAAGDTISGDCVEWLLALSW